MTRGRHFFDGFLELFDAGTQVLVLAGEGSGAVVVRGDIGGRATDGDQVPFVVFHLRYYNKETKKQRNKFETH